MKVDVELLTVVLLFLAGVVFTIAFSLLIYFLVKFCKRVANRRRVTTASPHEMVPPTLDTLRSGRGTTRQMLSSRREKKRRIFNKKTSKKASISRGLPAGQFATSPTSKTQAFTVTTTIENAGGINKNKLVLETQKLELDESFSKKDEVKDFKLRLELSASKDGDQSLTFDGDISNLRSPNVGKLVVMDFDKKGAEAVGVGDGADDDDDTLDFEVGGLSGLQQKG